MSQATSAGAGAVTIILTQSSYEPGDLSPDGYLAWHEWADD